MTYGTGETVSYVYDHFGNVTQQKLNGTTAFERFADRGGKVIKEKDYINNYQFENTYDTTDRLVRQTVKDISITGDLNNHLYSFEYGYDLNNNITKLSGKFPLFSFTNNFTYGKDNLLTKYELNSSRNVTYIYDGLNRLTNTTLNTTNPINTSYTYYDSVRGDGYTTTKLETENINGVTYRYVYDNLGNITDIYKGNTHLYYYEYDAMNQLVYSADYENNMAYTYDYDADGNITAEYIYKDGATGPSSQTTINVYTYGDSNWKDKLTAYKGQAITYDQIGNPLTYRDGITMTWQNGRQLATLQQGNNSISYKYDSNSIRTSKTVNGVEHTYAYLNGKLMYETRGNAKFYYSYDANGTLYSVNYTLTDSSTMQTYYYTHNAQGDIIGIYDSTGTLVAKYSYGDWGNVLSITDADGNAITEANHIANLNPFRYRSYYYDSEIGFYYLMSRYYDPVTHRFINADNYTTTGQGLLGNNMFSYCSNNSINRIDVTGKSWGEVFAFVKQIFEIVTNSVLVISNSEPAWMTSSKTMGDNMASAVGKKYSYVHPTTTNNFSNTWSNTTAESVIIHTHGSPNVLSGKNLNFTTDDMAKVAKNTNIKLVLITSCSVGGNNGDRINMGQLISQKIAPDGIVVCSTTIVSGADTYFSSTDGGQWVIYQNGVQIPANFPTTITMSYVANYWLNHY